MRMTISNSTSFHYLLVVLNPEIKKINVINEFENCINHYESMCDCEGQTKELKKFECEERYKSIIQNNLDEIKDYLLSYNSEYLFETFYPEQKVLAELIA